MSSPALAPTTPLSPTDDVEAHLLDLLKGCGATLAVLMVDTGAECQVVASVGRPPIRGLPRPLGTVQGIPKLVIERTVRTKQEQVSSNAAADPRFSGDPAVVMRTIRSVMALPVFLRSAPRAVLYLEDEHFASFPWSRVLMAKQSAIALGRALDRVRPSRQPREGRRCPRSPRAEAVTGTSLPTPMDVTELASGLSENLDNLIEPLLGHIASARVDSSSSRVGEILDEIERCALRLGGMAKRVGALGRRVPVAPQLTSATVLIRYAAHSLQTEADRDVRLVIEGECTHLVRVDHQPVVNALIELGRNAIEAARLRSRDPVIRFRTQPTWLHGGEPPDEFEGWLTIEVIDNGPGFDPWTLRKARRPFFTTSPDPQRLGLGLAYVEAVVSHHGGHLEFDAEPGIGNIARVWLPLERGSESHASVSSSTRVAAMSADRGASPLPDTVSFDSGPDGLRDRAP